MKIEFIVISAVILLINITNVNCIVSTYLQSIKHSITRQGTFEDRPNVSKNNGILLPPEEKPVYTYFIKAPYVNLQSKHGYPKNIIDSAEIDKNAPVEDFDDYSVEEVVINQVINEHKHISIDTNDSNSAKETFVESNKALRSRHKRNAFEMKERDIKKNLAKIRQKRVPAMYTGRYKSQEVDDIRNSIPVAKPKIKISDKKLKLKVNAIANDDAKQERCKRNTKNIIEEENLGTAISGFKFTGRLSFLTNNLAYKNIHS